MVYIFLFLMFHIFNVFIFYREGFFLLAIPPSSLSYSVFTAVAKENEMLAVAEALPVAQAC